MDHAYVFLTVKSKMKLVVLFLLTVQTSVY